MQQIQAISSNKKNPVADKFSGNRYVKLVCCFPSRCQASWGQWLCLHVQLVNFPLTNTLIKKITLFDSSHSMKSTELGRICRAAENWWCCLLPSYASSLHSLHNAVTLADPFQFSLFTRGRKNSTQTQTKKKLSCHFPSARKAAFMRL